MVSFGFESRLMYPNHCVMDVSYHLKMAGSYGCLSNTNAFPTFATGVVASHADKDCDLWIDSEGTLQLETQQYGPWIRVQPFTRTRKNVVVVPGFYSKKSNSTKATRPRQRLQTRAGNCQWWWSVRGVRRLRSYGQKRKGMCNQLPQILLQIFREKIRYFQIKFPQSSYIQI